MRKTADDSNSTVTKITPHRCEGAYNIIKLILWNHIEYFRQSCLMDSFFRPCHHRVLGGAVLFSLPAWSFMSFSDRASTHTSACDVCASVVTRMEVFHLSACQFVHRAARGEEEGADPAGYTLNGCPRCG